MAASISAVLVVCAASLCNHSTVDGFRDVDHCLRMAPILAGMRRAELLQDKAYPYHLADRALYIECRAGTGDNARVLERFTTSEQLGRVVTNLSTR